MQNTGVDLLDGGVFVYTFCLMVVEVDPKGLHNL